MSGRAPIPPPDPDITEGEEFTGFAAPAAAFAPQVDLDARWGAAMGCLLVGRGSELRSICLCPPTSCSPQGPSCRGFVFGVSRVPRSCCGQDSETAGAVAVASSGTLSAEGWRHPLYWPPPCSSGAALRWTRVSHGSEEHPWNPPSGSLGAAGLGAVGLSSLLSSCSGALQQSFSLPEFILATSRRSFWSLPEVFLPRCTL